MLTPAPILVLSLFTLLAASAPLPQEGNQQLDLYNKSPSSTLAPSTAAPTAAAATAVPSTARDLSAAVAAEALKEDSKQPITGDDGTKLGMAAVMEGLGTATGVLGALPLAGGLGARDESNIQGQNKKRAPVLPALDLLKNLPGLGGLTNLGGRDTSKLHKRDAQIGGDLLGNLPVIGSILGGGKVKRGKPDAELVPDAGNAAAAEETEVKKPADPFSRIKKIAAIVADVRGVTSKAKRRSLSKSIIDSANAKLDSQLDSALEDAKGTVQPENTSFPPGLPVKTPQDALDKRTDDQDEEHNVEYMQEDVYEDVFPVAHPHQEHERYGGLQNTYETHEELKRQPLDLTGAIPAKDLVENASGLKSVMDTFKSLSSAVQNRNS